MEDEKEYEIFGAGRFGQRRDYIRQVRDMLRVEGIHRVLIPLKTLYAGRGVVVTASTYDNIIHPPKNPGVQFKVKGNGNNIRAKRIARQIEDIVSEGESVRLQDL